MGKIRFACVFVFSAAFGVQSHAATIQAIPELAGGDNHIEVSAISADGSTVVGQSASASGYQGFVWTSAQGTTAINGMFWAYAVSADGSVVVGQGPSAAQRNALRWSAATGLQTLPDLAGGDLNAAGRAVSADGSLVAGYGTSTGSTLARAVRWVGTSLQSMNVGGLARAMTPDGATIVGWGNNLSQKSGFVWTSSGVTFLPNLSGSTSGGAYAISSDGSVIAGESVGSGGRTAVIWTDPTTVQSLGDLTGGAADSAARSISADGSIVTGVGNSDVGSEAFIWDATHGMRSLPSVLVNEYGLDLQGWKLTDAFVSADGRTFAGNGTNPQGLPEGWYFHLPDPTNPPIDPPVDPPPVNAVPLPTAVPMGLAMFAMLGATKLARRKNK